MRRQGRRQLITIIASIFFGVIAVVSLFGMFHEDGGSYETETQNTILYQGARYRKKDLVNLLVMGIDQGTEAQESEFYYNDGRADFLALVSVDVSTKSYTVLHINRDTITDVNVYGVRGEYVETRKEQIALAHTYGDGLSQSCGYMQDAVSSLLNGLQIDYYLSLTMPAVAIINDAVGGVSMTLNQDYTDIQPGFQKGEKVILTGEQALRFVRARKGVADETNVSRMERQMLYVEAMLTQLAEKVMAEEGFLEELFFEIEEYAITNCSVNTFSRIVGYVSDYRCIENRTLEGEAKKGKLYMEYYVDEEKKEQLLIDWFYQKI